MSNTGIFTTNDINELSSFGQWSGSGGQLELIQTIEHQANVTHFDFVNIKEDIYNVHFLTFNNLQTPTVSNYVEIRLSNDNGSTFETSNYDRGIQYGGINGTFGESKSTTAQEFGVLSYTTANNSKNGYVYLYNLGSDDKHSYITHHSPIGVENSTTGWFYFGSQQYMTAEKIDAIRVLNSGSNIQFSSGSMSLYGIRYS